jgi:hypothetical protein
MSAYQHILFELWSIAELMGEKYGPNERQPKVSQEQIFILHVKYC